MRACIVRAGSDGALANVRRVMSRWTQEKELIELDRKITNAEANLRRLYTERENRKAALIGPLPVHPLEGNP